MSTPFHVTGQFSRDIENESTVIPAAQLNALAILAQRGNQKAVEKIQCALLKGAVSIAQSYASIINPAEELVDQAYIGIPDAIRTYDSTKGVDFYLHATQWMRAKVAYFVDYNNPVHIKNPKKVKKMIKKGDLTLELNPLNAKLAEDSDTSLIDTLPFSVECDDFSEMDCQVILNKLPAKERQLLELIYIQGLNFREVGEVIGLTHERVRQIHTIAIQKASNALRRTTTA